MPRKTQTTPPPAPVYDPVPPSRNTDYRDVDGSPDFIDWSTKAVVAVMTTPVVWLAKLLGQFVERGSKGILFLGGTAFLFGAFVGADNFYQMGTGKALLPWFTESDWVGDLAVANLPRPLNWALELWGGGAVVGWTTVSLHVFSLGFLICLAFSFLTQYTQGRAIRGQGLERARAEFDKWNAPTVPGKPDPTQKLDMATVSWQQLKRTGTGQRRFTNLIALFCWAAEFIGAFSAHNPLNYTGQAGLFLGCTVYALVTIVAGEAGYAVFCETLEETQG